MHFPLPSPLHRLRHCFQIYPRYGTRANLPLRYPGKNPIRNLLIHCLFYHPMYFSRSVNFTSNLKSYWQKFIVNICIYIYLVFHSSRSRFEKLKLRELRDYIIYLYMCGCCFNWMYFFFLLLFYAWLFYLSLLKFKNKNRFRFYESEKSLWILRILWYRINVFFSQVRRRFMYFSCDFNVVAGPRSIDSNLISTGIIIIVGEKCVN